MKAIAKSSITQNYTTNQCKTCQLNIFCIRNNGHVEKTNSSKELVKQRVVLKSRNFLFNTRESLRHLYVVTKGALKAYVNEADGRQKIINFYLPGEILGFEAIEEKTYSFSVEAISETSLCIISYDRLLLLIATYPELQEQIMHLMSKRIRAGSCVTHYRAEDRFTNFLIEMAGRLQHDNHADTVEFKLPITRKDIADYLSLAPETISRLIYRLQQERLVSIENKLIKIPSIKNLCCHA